MNKLNNWDKYYKKIAFSFGTILGLKGNVVLNGVVANYIIKNSIIFNNSLEIGSGGGRLSKILSNYFDQCFILDKSKYAINLAHKTCPKCKTFNIDIFNFTEKLRLDVVVSIGLVEHFNKRDMETLVLKHIELAKSKGNIFICVPSYSKKREYLVKTPDMIKKFGFQDPKAEFKISSFLNTNNIFYKKIYLDKIILNKWYQKLLRYINVFTYKLFNYNIETLFHNEKGNYVLFYIKK